MDQVLKDLDVAWLEPGAWLERKTSGSSGTEGHLGVYTRVLPSLPFVAMVRPTMTMAEILRGVGYRKEETGTP